jgi:dihydrofolate reductase
MINSILACDNNGGIGYKDKLPWPYLKDDMEKFVSLTKNNIIVMGYNTFKSIKNAPLAGRFNIVIIKKGTIVSLLHRNALFIDEDDFMKIIKIKKGLFSPIKKSIYIIGGQYIFDRFIDSIDLLHLTRIDTAYESDKYIDLELIQSQFDMLWREKKITNNGIDFYFETHIKKKL